ncbi:MAG: hemerythrin domain-containing protein [Candidatus Nanopelagicales bacterium]|nr:hemerythrin domain-containing protein [Candidatus Nanopelagicales bacterium]
MTSVSEFMSNDHDRLDALFAEFLSADEVETTVERLAAFDTGLRRHIEWEERILFPEFEQRTGMAESGPTSVMRIEHERIDALLLLIGDRSRTAGAGPAVDELREVLTAHNLKEEMILYPWIDRELTDVEIATALAAMQD